MRDGGDEFDKEYSYSLLAIKETGIFDVFFGITAAVDVDNQVIRFSD